MFSDCLQIGNISSNAQVNAVAAALSNQGRLMLHYQKALNVAAQRRGLTLSSAGAT